MVLTILVKINKTFGCATQEMHTWWQFPPRIDHWNEINIFFWKGWIKCNNIAALGYKIFVPWLHGNENDIDG